MRITCPNCQAQYDVDPSMIPEKGRDVQCSSCAHTWFQTRAVEEPEEVEAGAAPDDAGTEDSRLPEEIEAEAATGVEDEVPETWEEVAPEPEAGDGEEPAAGDTEEPTASDEERDPREEMAATAGAGDDTGEADRRAPEAAAGVSDEEDAAEPETDADGPGDALPAEDEDEEDDRLRAAIDRSRTGPAEPDPEESEAFRTSMREAVTAPEAEDAPETAGTGEDDDSEDPSGDEEVAGGGPALDREVADILREEAAFEATRRRSEDAPPAFEPQGDLALEEGRPSSVLRERLERMRGDGVPEPTIAASAAAATGAVAGPRRERLPDIEEINSSLRPGEDDEPAEPPLSAAEVTATRRSGFRTGFAAVVLVTAILVGAYVYAPQIIRLVPAAEPAMISYVEAANSARDRIDGMMARAISGINTMVGDGSNGA